MRATRWCSRRRLLRKTRRRRRRSREWGVGSRKAGTRDQGPEKQGQRDRGTEGTMEGLRLWVAALLYWRGSSGDFKGLAVPMGFVGGGGVGGFEEVEEGGVGVGGLAHVVVGEDEFAEVGVEAGGDWEDGNIAVAGGLGV